MEHLGSPLRLRERLDCSPAHEDNAGTALFPQIAVDAAGNAIAVWKQSDGSSYNIWAARYVLGSGWTAPKLLAAGDAWQPQIAVDAAGNAFAVWGRSDGIWAARYVSGSGWTAPQLIDDAKLTAYYPQIAFDAAGNAIAVWQQSGTIWAARYE